MRKKVKRNKQKREEEVKNNEQMIEGRKEIHKRTLQ